VQESKLLVADAVGMNMQRLQQRQVLCRIFSERTMSKDTV
jgi:hypothetical protein